MNEVGQYHITYICITFKNRITIPIKSKNQINILTVKTQNFYQAKRIYKWINIPKCSINNPYEIIQTKWSYNDNPHKLAQLSPAQSLISRNGGEFKRLSIHEKIETLFPEELSEIRVTP